MAAKPWSVCRAEIYALIGRNPKSNRLVARLADPEPDHVILDIGCGPGAAVRAVAPVVAKVYGVDNSAAMVRIAWRRSRHLANVEFRDGSAEALPMEDAAVDRVWTVHAFHHWSDEADGCAEVLRVLRPGGRFLIVERLSNGAHGLTRAAAEAASERLVGAGFGSASIAPHGKQLVITALV